MSFKEWITRPSSLRILEDSFALNRETMLAGLRRAIQQQQKVCDEVWLIAHFFDTFTQLQEFLGRENIEYQIADEPIFSPAALRSEEDRPAVVRLVLASMVRANDANLTRQRPSHGRRPSLAVIVCERHPSANADETLRKTIRTVPANVTYGYVLSMDDVVVKEIASPMTLEVLQQLGLNEQELIASHHLSQLLERRIRRNSTAYLGSVAADSAEEWIELNSDDRTDQE